MSVLIKGMNIPKSCWECPCCIDYGDYPDDHKYYCLVLACDLDAQLISERRANCPMEEVTIPPNAQECLNKIKDAVLGEDWCIVDPVGGSQANEIMTEEIILKWKRISKK